MTQAMLTTRIHKSFLSPNFIFAACVMLGSVGRGGSVSPIMHISLSAQVRAGRWHGPITVSASDHWPIRARCLEENPSMKISLSAEARWGRCTGPVACPSLGVLLKSQSNVTIMHWVENDNSRAEPPVIPELSSQGDAPPIWGPPATIGVTQHCLVSWVLCLVLSWKHQTQ